MIYISIISLFVQRKKDILRYLYTENDLIPTAIEEVNAGVVVLDKFFYGEFLFDQNGSSDQTHTVMRIFDDIVYQLLSEFAVFIHPKWIALEGFKKFFKLLQRDHIPMCVVEAIHEFEKIM